MPHAHDAPGAVPLAAMWFGMMAAMMAPTAWPWVRAFHRFGVDRASPPLATAQFGAGYLAAWLAYSIAAAAVQSALEEAGMSAHGGVMPPAASAGLFIIAGLYQFSPLKRACLAHCRSPFGYFLAQWRDGPAAGFVMGVRHGLHCLGCCWALMLTMLAVGLSSLWWMVALAAVAFAEQVVPRGQHLRRPLGLALIAAGVWFAAAAR